MSEKADSPAPNGAHATAPAATEMDVWTQLATFVARPDTDPVLRLLVGEAILSHRELRGVTATIANRYRALIDAVPDAITIHDDTGRTLDANASACRLLGQERSTLLEQSLLEIFCELDSEFLLHLQETTERDSGLIRSSTIRRADGISSALELNARCYLDGQQKRIIVATRELGPRERLHADLHHSEAELRQLMRNMDKGVVVRNRLGHIVSSNPAACRILQMSEPDLLALRSDQFDDWHFIDENGRTIGDDALPWSRAMKTGKSTESAICGLKSPSDHRTRWLSLTAVPRFDIDTREPGQVVSIFADITPIKQDASLFSHAQSLTNLGAWQLISGTDSMIWSAQMHAIFDVPLTTPVSRDRMLSHFSGMDQRRLRQALDAAKSEETTEIMARITTVIGRRRQVKIRLRALDRESTNGDVIGCVQDVTNETEPEGVNAAD
ncbi:MAG: PAS domain-containing protein [Dokdonella sp.]